MHCLNCNQPLTNTGFTSLRLECLNHKCSASAEFVQEKATLKTSKGYLTLDEIVKVHGLNILVRYSNGMEYEVLGKRKFGYVIKSVATGKTNETLSSHKCKAWELVWK